jgi:hypothetical protein
VKARAVGLLSEDQHITDARVFKRAKKSLGIKSLRAGFGARSRWLWQLPQLNQEAQEEEAAPQPQLPIDWVEGVARLDSDRPPNDVPRHRWRQFVEDCNKFLRPSENWAERAARLGWDAMALFGCAPKRPLDYLGSAGLVWAINGGRLLELHRDWAVIDIPVHGSQRIFYRRNVDPAKMTLPWTKQTSSSQPAGSGIGDPFTQPEPNIQITTRLAKTPLCQRQISRVRGFADFYQRFFR